MGSVSLVFVNSHISDSLCIEIGWHEADAKVQSCSYTNIIWKSPHYKPEIRGKCYTRGVSFSIDLPLYVGLIAVLNLLLVILLVPNGLRILNLEKNRGYVSNNSSILQYVNLGAVLFIWLTCNFLIIFFKDFLSITPFFFINLLITHHFFVYHRHSGISRGMGAPGYFTYLTNFFAFFLLISSYSNNQTIIKLVTQSLAIILGLIFLVSGIYKSNSGYSLKNNYGINVGLCNEMWSQFPRIFLKLNAGSKISKVLNFISVWGEIVGGVLLVTGVFSKIGSIILILMFLGIGFLVRLGILPIQIMVTLLIPFVNVEVSKVQNQQFLNYLSVLSLAVILIALFELISYLHYFSEVGISSFRIPFKISKIAHFSSKFLGTILWRVFTPDITALHINVYAINNAGDLVLLSKWDSIWCARYRNVGEAIALTSIFTSLRYWPDNPELFKIRLIHYCQTLESSKYSEFKFTVSHIEINQQESYLLPVCDFIVNLEKSSVVKNVLNDTVDISKKERFSSLTPGSSVGTYERKGKSRHGQDKS